MQISQKKQLSGGPTGRFSETDIFCLKKFKFQMLYLQNFDFVGKRNFFSTKSVDASRA